MLHGRWGGNFSYFSLFYVNCCLLWCRKVFKISFNRTRNTKNFNLLTFFSSNSLKYYNKYRLKKITRNHVVNKGDVEQIINFPLSCVSRVPTRTGKPGKMGRHFPVREKSGNFEQTGKVRENHTKYWKTQGISDKYYYLFFSDI